MPTSIPGLDRILGGGIPTGSLIVIAGAPGTGKTTLLQQLCFTWASTQPSISTLATDEMTGSLNAALETKGEKNKGAASRAGKGKALYFSTYSEPHHKLIEHVSQFAFFDKGLLDTRIELLSLTTVMDENLEQVGKLIVDTARREKAALVSIDGFGVLESMAANEHAVRRLLYQLSSQLSLLGATTIISLESSLGNVSEGTNLAIADGIIGLYSKLSGTREYFQSEVRKLRGMNRLTGLHTYRISESGITFYPRLETLVPKELDFPRSNRAKKRLGFGLPELETMLSGGLPYGSSTIIAGSPGVGKTQMCLQYLLEGARHRENGLYIGFYESTTDLLQRCERLGMDLSSAVEKGFIKLLTFTPVELEPDLLTVMIQQEVEERGVQRMALDGILELERASEKDNRSLDFMAAFGTYCKARGITIVSTYEISKVIGQELDLSNTTFMRMAENLLLLKQLEYKMKLHRIISILKLRDSGYDSTIREFTITDHIGMTILQQMQSGEGVLTGLARSLTPDRK